MKAKSRVLQREINLVSADLERSRAAVPGDGTITFRYLLQPFGHFQFISPNVTYLTGHTPAEYYKFPNLWIQNIHPNDRGMQVEILRGKAPQNPVNIRMQSANHGFIPVKQNFSLGLDEEGNPLSIAAECIIADEMQLRQMSGDLSHPGLVSFIDEGPIPTIISGIDSRDILFANKQFIRLFKYSLDQLLNTKITDLPIWENAEDRDYFSMINSAKGEIAPKEMSFKDADGKTLMGMVNHAICPDSWISLPMHKPIQNFKKSVNPFPD
jgi:PAS domain-containing protein